MRVCICDITGCKLTDYEDESKVRSSEAFAQRLITGRAAENFFLANYKTEPAFCSFKPFDVTQTGCGYDFSLRNEHEQSFIAVEVKGISTLSGNILMTDKEHKVASIQKTSYYLYVVKNFAESPFAVSICDPVNYGVNFKRIERKIINISWTASL
jgi:hypothetical protein